MRKLLSIFSLVLIYCVLAFGQAIDIPITAVNGPNVKAMAVGLDLTATNGIDPALGEGILPPPPPAGAYDARFDLTPFGAPFQTLKDYRNAPAFPFTGTTEHRIKWQLATGAPTFAIDYVLPVGAQMLIQDLITGTIINSGQLSGTGSFLITFAVTELKITMTYTNIEPIVLGPTFTTTPASLNFGTVNVSANATLPVTITNDGTLDLEIAGIVSSDAQFTFAPSAFPLTIPSGGGTSILNVTFTPTAAGTVNGTLTFTHNAPSAGTTTDYSVTGVGYVPAPVFAIAPVAPLTFAPVEVGFSANLNVTVSNTGDAPLTLSGIVSSNAQYTFTPNAFPVNIAASGNQVFVVTFTPTAAGVVNADLTFTHNGPGPNTVYAVTGTGYTTAPVFNLSAASLDFGNVGFPGGNKTLPITVTNSGNAVLTISGIVSSDAQFTFAPNAFPVNVAAGGNTTFNVSFAPAAAGAASGDLTFTHNAAGSPSVLPLSGFGQTQGGLLKFALPSQNLLDGTENNPDAIVLNGYTGQPMKALQFDVIIGKSNGRLILRSVERGAAITTPEFNFSYEIYPGPTLPDGSSRDRIKVVIVGNGTNAILPNPGDQEIMKFAFDIVDITGPSATTTNGLENVLGATSTPVINANISTGADEIINIFNGTLMGLLGDVNLDDHVNILDILLMIDHILGRTTLTGLAFTQGDIAPWAVGDPLPVPDGVINVLDLSVLQNIVLTGMYPSGTPVYKSIANPFELVSNGLDKITPGMNAKLTFYLNESKGMTVVLETLKKVKGIQIELEGLSTFIPYGTEISSVFNNALYYQANDFLRTLTFDGEALAIDEGEYMIAKILYNLSDADQIAISNIIVADENIKAMEKVEVEIRYDEYNPNVIPLDYMLSQNFPNPFNPTTNIKFEIPVDGFVTIKVYDMLGQAVADLYSSNTQAGTYTLNWDGKDNSGNAVSSGSYIYKMTAGDFVQSKKMVLLK